MTDTPNIGLKKYGGTDPANLLTGYNASMDTLDTVIKQSQDDIDKLHDSVFRFRGNATEADLNSTMYHALGLWALTSLSYTNKPTGTNANWGTLVTFASDTNSTFSQIIVTPSDNPSKLYVRRYSGSTWSSWYTISGS